MSAPMEKSDFVTFVCEICKYQPNLILSQTSARNQDSSELLSDLKKLTELFKSCKNRSLISETQLLPTICTWIEETELSLQNKDIFFIELFRILRNSCAGNEANQLELARHTTFIDVVARIIRENLELQKGMVSKQSICNASDINPKEQGMLLLRCCIQFLVNYVAGSQQNTLEVWEHLFPSLRALMDTGDASLKKYTCCLIYTGLNFVLPEKLLSEEEGHEILGSVIRQLSEQDCEWSLFIVEKMIVEPCFLERMWPKLEDNEKSLVLTVIENKIPGVTLQKEGLTGSDEAILTPHVVSYLCNQWKRDAYIILGLSQESLETLQPIVVTHILDLILRVLDSSAQDLADIVKGDISLLTCAVNLLHSIHMIGKEGSNLFTEQNKMSQVGDTPENNPAFGLKRDLIRLLGTMCFRHRTNQDKLRELGGIPLIMNHTNMDSRNPFIIQWSILAVRNLCEDNLENQGAIASMQTEGMADNMNTLRDFGVDAQLKDGKIVIKNINKEPAS